MQKDELTDLSVNMLLSQPRLLLLRRNRLSLFFFILIFFVALCGCKKSEGPAVGAEAFNVSYTLPDGSKHSLSECRGKKILLVFWSTWCDVCKTELPDLNQLAQSLATKNSSTSIIGVIIRDQKNKVFEFLNENKLQFINGVGDSKPISDTYQLTGVPEIFYIDESGKFLPFKNSSGGSAVKLIGGQPWNDPLFTQQFFDDTAPNK